MTKFFFYNHKRYQKTQSFTLIQHPLKKLLKNAQKSYKQNKFEVKKVHISVTFLLITCFWIIFSKLFQRIRNQREILRFLTPFLIKNFRSYYYFFQTLIANAQEMAQKKENLFFINVSQNLIMQPSKGLPNQVVKIVVPQ